MVRALKLPGLTLLATLAALIALAATTGAAPAPHERKEVAGLAVVFGAEPEPAITEEVQFLRWRVRLLADEEPYSGFEDAEVVIARNGEEIGTFQVRGTRREPGLYQTRHIFTGAGEYETVLRFRKGEEEEVHTVDFKFHIADRSSLEIPLSVEREVREVVSQFKAALRGGDSTTVVGLLHPSARIYEGGHAETREEYRSGHLRGDIAFLQSVQSETTWDQVVPGDDVALYMSEYHTTGQYRDREIDSRGTETIVLVSTDAGWRIRHIHWSSR